MRMFRTSPFGDEVNLDDSETYSHLPDGLDELRDLMLKEIGYAHCWMNYWNVDMMQKNPEQRIRVEILVVDFTTNESENYDNVRWYKEQVFMFQDEIENMC